MAGWRVGEGGAKVVEVTVILVQVYPKVITAVSTVILVQVYRQVSAVILVQVYR